MAFGNRITNAARDVMSMVAQRRAAAQPNEQQIDPLAAYNGPGAFNVNSPSYGFEPGAGNGIPAPGYKRWYDGAYTPTPNMPGAVLQPTSARKWDDEHLAEWREDPERKKYYDILNSWSEGYHYDGPPNGENYFGSLGPQYKRWYDGAYSTDGSMPGAVIKTPEALERSYRDGYEEWLDSINRRNRSW